MINPEFMMYRDGAEGCRTIDDFLKVVGELERGQYEELVDQNRTPKIRSQTLEEFSVMNRWT